MPYDIVNLRGTSGSGKSTLMQQFITKYNLQPELVGPGNLVGRKRAKYDWYVNRVESLAVVGDYQTDCGGCDGITAKGQAQDIIQDRVRTLVGSGCKVLFEGLLISHIYQRYADMAIKEFPGRMVLAALDTPLEVAIKQVSDRREKAGKAREFNVHNTEKMYNDVQRCAAKAKKDGVPWVWVDHKNAFKQLEELLGL